MQVQKIVWDYFWLAVVPVHMFIVAQKTGGHAIGAFGDQNLVGFALAYSGALQPGRVSANLDSSDVS